MIEKQTNRFDDKELYTYFYDEITTPISQAFHENNIPIVFSCSNEYARFFSTCLESIIETSDNNTNYDIIVLEHNITKRQKLLLLSMINSKKNFSLRFINLKNEIQNLKITSWAHFSIVTCFKLFLFSEAFSNFSKIIVLDTDLIFLNDAQYLYKTDISQYDMAAVDDVIMKEHLRNNKLTGGFAPKMSFMQYISEYLNFGNYSEYYNTGVILLNLKNCRKKNYFQKALYLLNTKGYMFQEQDVFNDLCGKNTFNLDFNWNVVGFDVEDKIKNSLSNDELELYKKAVKKPYVLHYAGGLKPWNVPSMPYANLYYKYARNTPFYEELIQNFTSLQTYRYNIVSQTENQNIPTVKKILNLFAPKNSKLRKIISKALPRESFRREVLRKAYLYFFNNDVRNSINNKVKKIIIISIYRHNLKKSIKTNVALFDSKNGTDIAGNIYRLVLELQKKEYHRLKIYLTYQSSNLKRIRSILKNESIKVRLIKWNSLQYFILLARAKYITTDLYVNGEYIKRKDQILISTAHGTPLKGMGIDCFTEFQGFLQNTHTLADYQLFSSQYMKETLFNAFMENQLFCGHALKSGYPRNDIFFNKSRRNLIRKKFLWEDKIVYAYLPTFRGIAGSFEDIKQIQAVTSMCDYLDNKLTDSQILLIKFHNFTKSSIDCSNYKHIKLFPDNYEVYEVLNATDMLITDYSSVFFDYANSKQKIILYQYDKNDYCNNRKLYLSEKEIPFPIVYDDTALLKEMNSTKQYDDKDFLKRFCQYDCYNSSELICRTIFGKNKSCDEFEPVRNNKKNIFIYAGKWNLNEYSSFLARELINQFDKTKYNLFVYHYEYDNFSNPYRIQSLYPQCEYFSFLLYPYNMKKIHYYLNHNKKIPSKISKIECLKNFSSLPIDFYIDLAGDDPLLISTAQWLECPKIIIFSNENVKFNELLFRKYDTFFTYTNNNINKNKKLEKGWSNEIINNNCTLILNEIEQVINSRTLNHK